MFKKIITISLFTVSALALINANAATLSDTAQNTKQNNKASHATSAKRTSKPATEKFQETRDNTPAPIQTISVPRVSEVPVGTYITGQMGYTDTHMKNQVPFGWLDNNGLAGRLALGYKLNQNFAMEVGFLQLQDGKTKVDQNGFINKTSNQYAIDVAGKGILPLANNVNVYGKVGVAYLTTRIQANIPGETSVNINDAYGIAKHKWAPEVAVGMSYDITPNVSVDTSLTHIQPLGNDRPGNIDFLAVGVGYTFG